MSLSIIAEPYQYVGAVYSRTPIVFRFLTGYNVTGTKPKIRLTLGTHLVAINKVLTFSYNGNTISFSTVSGVGTPDDSGTQIAANAGGTFTLAQYMLIFVANLSSNYYFSTELVITATGSNWIEFSTVDNCDDFVITTDINGAIVATIVAGVLPTTQANYKVVIDVLISQQFGFGATEKLAGQIELPSYATPYQQEAAADISKIIDAYLAFPSPWDMGSNYTNNCCNVRIRYAEKYGNPAVLKEIKYSAQFSVAKGGYTVARLMQSAFVFPELNAVFQSPAVSQKMATLLPPKKITTPQTIEILSYYNPAVGSSVSTVMAYYTIYTTTGYSPFGFSKVSFFKNFVYLGLSLVDIALYAGIPLETITHYEVYLHNDTANTVTYPQTYIIEHCPFAIRTMYIANRYGGIDSLPLKGAATETLKTSAETSLFLPSEYDEYGNYQGDATAFTNAAKGTSRVTARTSNDVYRTSTGLVPEDHLPWIKDTLRMEKTWISITEQEAIDLALGISPYWLPIAVISDSIQIKRELDDLYNVTFDYRLLYDETV